MKKQQYKHTLTSKERVRPVLMYKVMRSKVLEMSLMIGIEPDSEGLKRARKEGFIASSEGIDFIFD